MTSQFSFLAAEFPDVYTLAARAEGLARNDPRAACFYSRLALETAVNWLYRSDGSLRRPYDNTLSSLIHETTFQRLVGVALTTKARLIKDLGNRAVHETRPVPANDGVAAVRELFHFSYWLARTYARGDQPSGTLLFAPDALPQTASVTVERLDQLKAAAARFTDAVQGRVAAEQATAEARSARDAEVAALQAEIARLKAQNARIPDNHDYDEAATRETFIDLLLAEAGWPCDRAGKDTEYRVTGMPYGTGEGFVDYVLWGDDGKPLAVVEAKRTRKDPRVGQQQAKVYADRLEAETGRRPIIFCSNGYEHWLWDDAHYPPRPIQGFLTKDELQRMILGRSSRASLAATEIDTSIAGRYYQTRAIRRVAEGFERDHVRKSLLVMATGSGKTRTVIALCDVMMRAKWAHRILFLADRRSLVKQAANAFTAHLPWSSPVNLLADHEATGRVYVSTYPTMMKLIDEIKDGKKRFGPGYFDMIVIDEAHRSVYKKYGAIFEYFDSFLVGLTATPKDEIDHDTYGLFDLERGVPTDAYTLDEAVDDGFLVPCRAVSVPLRFQREGIRYDDLSEEEKDQWDEIEWSEDETAPDSVDANAINKWLFNTDTVDKVLEYLMLHGQKVAGGDRLGKTIIFAKNQEHARFITERFDIAYPHLKGSFARCIVSSDPYSETLLDDFTQADKAPHIAISVDMLDTGVDVPEVVNLVFFKTIRSRTKFWQMLGRGTRLCEDLFGPGQDKAFFTVFDFCQNFEFFNQNPTLTEGSGGASLSKKLFTARVGLISAIDAAQAESGPNAGLKELREGLAKRLVDEISGMTPANFIVRPKRRLVEKYTATAAWSLLGLDEITELTTEVAGLPSEYVDDDQGAKEFDILILRAQLALLTADARFTGYKDKIVKIVSLLEELANVPMVAQQLELIEEVQTDAYWQDITPSILEVARKRLRALVKLIEVKKRPIIFTDFEDVVGEGTAVGVAGVSAGTDMAAFRRKARHFLKENENHIAVLKVRRNEQLTPTDLRELERMFVASGMAAEDVEKVGTEVGLGLFVRSLVGLDREAAKAAFSEFTAGRTLTANQIEFLNLIIDHLTEKGQMDPRLLYESPFTDKDPMGVNGVFELSDAKAVVEVIEAVRRSAAA
jgi:type I restriction enzyme R subunit